jgi:hypothetical protein
VAILLVPSAIANPPHGQRFPHVSSLPQRTSICLIRLLFAQASIRHKVRAMEMSKTFSQPLTAMTILWPSGALTYNHNAQVTDGRKPLTESIVLDASF